MKSLFRNISSRVGRTRGPGLILMLPLLLAVLVPSLCFLWFMNEAVRNERLAVRQKLSEAYQGYLSLAQQRLESAWRQRAGDLESDASTLPAPVLFATRVRSGMADSVVVFDTEGRVAYPDSIPPPVQRTPPAGWQAAQRLESTDPALAANAYANLARQATNATYEARALQAQARCLVRAGNAAEAIKVVTGPLAAKRFKETTDFQDRLLVPNALLLALEHLEGTLSAEANTLRERLRTRLLDYEENAMRSSQRRFLNRELQRLFPEDTGATLLAAEDLAARYVEGRASQPPEIGVTASEVPGVWQFPSVNGRVVALFETAGLRDRMLATTAGQSLPKGCRVHLVAPGAEARDVLASLPVGPTFPGWRLAFSLEDHQVLDTTVDQRITGYIWTGVLALATVVVLAALALGLVRRQAALSRLRDDLVANVTHELKTPLSSMRLLVETLLNAPTLQEQTTREYLELIAKENVRLSRLIDSFLTFSRIERNKYTFEFKEAEPGKIAENAAAVVRGRFDASGCIFDSRIAPDLPTFLADADAMVTVLVNLLDNAWKYSGSDKRITLATTAENDAVLFRVTDNGIGLSPRDRKRIFSRFCRVESGEAHAGGGCGLGLSIVQFIVTAHHGTVNVESEPGQGSTFIVAIPTPDANRTEVPEL